MAVFAFIFILTPIIELWLLFLAADKIGWEITLAVVIFTAIIGLRLLRQQGAATLERASRKIRDGQVPASEVLEGLMLTLCGSMLLTPGFITDILGFLLLTPLIRNFIIAKITNYGIERFFQNLTKTNRSNGTDASNNTQTRSGRWGSETNYIKWSIKKSRQRKKQGETIEGQVTSSTLHPAANQDLHDDAVDNQPKGQGKPDDDSPKPNQ